MRFGVGDRWSLLLALVVSFPLLALAQATGQSGGAKFPTPDAASQEKATRLPQDVYGDRFDAATTPGERQKLARELAEKAGLANEDRATLYVLLREAGSLSVRAADAELAIRVIDQMQKTFRIDAFSMKRKALLAIARSAATASQNKTLAETALTLLEEAAHKNDFGACEELGSIASEAARKAKERALAKQAAERIQQIQEMAGAYAEIKGSLAALEKNPADPAANFAVGRYFCLFQGDWEMGLPYLALGTDLPLKALAAKEVEGVTEAGAQVALGDGWWDLAEKQATPGIKKRMQARATVWYQKALPSLPDGLAREKVALRCKTAGPADAAKARAIAAALNWLARHQGPEGSWSLGQYNRACKDPTCTGLGSLNTDAGATALALLPFLAAGQSHQDGPYQKTIQRGLSWLLQHQKANGDLAAGAAQGMYSHGLAAIVLCEAYAETKDRRIGRPAQQALRFIEAAQHPRTGGWRYSPGEEGDTSVLGWQLTALKSGQFAGLSVSRPAFDGAGRWLKSAAQGRQGGLYCYTPGAGTTPTMTAVGLVAQLHLDHGPEEPMIAEGLNVLLAQPPNRGPRSVYYWYYAAQVIERCSGKDPEAWGEELRQALIGSQCKDGCAAGSWDPDRPAKDPWGDAGGRVFVTSLSALSLEVSDRKLAVFGR